MIAMALQWFEHLFKRDNASGKVRLDVVLTKMYKETLASGQIALGVIRFEMGP